MVSCDWAIPENIHTIEGHKFTSFCNYSVLLSLNKVYYYYYIYNTTWGVLHWISEGMGGSAYDWNSIKGMEGLRSEISTRERQECIP